MRVAVAVLSLLLVSACTDSAAPEAGPTPTPTQTATATPTPPLTVPDLVGLAVGEAMSALKAVGLRVTQGAVAGATCAGDGLVVRQRPRAGRQAEPKQGVRILSDRLACQPLRRRSHVGDADTRLVDAFVQFARDGHVEPAAADRVLFFLGGAPAGERRRGANERTAWRMCPPERYYAAGACPFDVLHVLIFAAVNDFPLVYTHRPRHGVCLIESVRADLSAVQHLRRAVVSPTGRAATCASDFRIELYYDGDRVAAVNLVMSEP